MLLSKDATLLDKTVIVLMIALMFIFTHILSNNAYYRYENNLMLQMNIQKEVIKKLQEKVKEVR